METTISLDKRELMQDFKSIEKLQTENLLKNTFISELKNLLESDSDLKDSIKQKLWREADGLIQDHNELSNISCAIDSVGRGLMVD
ncbi:hypothetical protein [Aestuariivivens sediminis]|uniref:hypothetical protein n=1 Tax=Aestuariivivens sediminis TaxID=2913557 RepID=UPI001F5AECE8|nr:hypothetical protein [Aestuariivivens sediminis]